MLVLTRSSDEEIRIGDDIVVRVLDVKGDRVRIGIAAPAEIPVHRQEIYLEIERTNREALQIAGAGLKGASTLLAKQAKASKKKAEAGSLSPMVASAAKSQRRKLSVTEVSHGS